MAVNDINLNPGQAGNTGATGNTGAAGANTNAARQIEQLRIPAGGAEGLRSNRGEPKSDEVELSSLSNKLNELQPGSPQREAYLESLRLEVASGRYDDSPEATAKQIVNDSIKDGSAQQLGSTGGL
jgi:anti-sigma28 factor (negative regulator of flagellin synthesis)